MTWSCWICGEHGTAKDAEAAFTAHYRRVHWDGR